MAARRTRHNWCTWVQAADQWFIAYASLPHLQPGVPFWCAGHAVELYLKAAVVKGTGDQKKAMSFRHDISDLWKECRKLDPSFLPAYDLRDSILTRDILLLRAPSRMQDLSPDDLQHFFDNEPLYIVAKLQGDLKYFPLHMHSRPDSPGVLVEAWPNMFWLKFVKSLRQYLEFPPPGTRDFIRHLLERDLQCVPDDTIAYLHQLYE